MEDKRLNLLKNAKVSKAVNTLAAPAIISFLVMAFYNTADGMFVSWLGTDEVSATQVIFPLMMIANAIGLSFGIGGASYISRLLGQDDKESAETVVTVNYITTIFLGILFAIVTNILIVPIVTLFGADASILNLTVDYGRFIIIGSVFILPTMVLNNALRAEGSASLSMIGMLIGSVINIILDPIFIFTLDFGIEGAAMATIVSQLFSLVFLTGCYLRKKTILPLHLSHFKPSVKIYREVLVIGIPTFFRQLLVSISMALLNNTAIKYGGSTLLAGLGIAIKLNAIPLYFNFGYAQGMQPVIGYNFGAKSKERVLQALKHGITVQVTVSSILAILFWFLAPSLFAIFKASSEVTAVGVWALRLFLLTDILLAINNSITTYYQSLGKGLQSTILAMARQGYFYVPLIFILPPIFKINGVLSIQLVADVITTILCLVMMYSYFKRDGLDTDIANSLIKENK